MSGPLPTCTLVSFSSSALSSSSVVGAAVVAIILSCSEIQTDKLKLWFKINRDVGLLLFAFPHFASRMKRSGAESGAPVKKSKQQGSAFSASTSAPQTNEEQLAADARLARELAEHDGLVLKGRSWHEPKKGSKMDKGKSKAVHKQPIRPAKVEVDDSDDSDDLIIVDDQPAKAQKKPIASIFAPKPPPAAKVKPDPEQPPPKRTPTASPAKASGSSFFASNSKGTPIGAPVASTSKLVATKPLDTSVYEFNPSTDVDTSLWPNGRMPYSFLTQAFVIVSATKSRLIISRVLTNLLRTAVELDPTSLEAIVYLTTNRLGPAHEKDLELGIGSQVLGKAIRDVSGLTPTAIKTLSNKLGDPGKPRSGHSSPSMLTTDHRGHRIRS